MFTKAKEKLLRGIMILTNRYPRPVVVACNVVMGILFAASVKLWNMIQEEEAESWLDLYKMFNAPMADVK